MGRQKLIRRPVNDIKPFKRNGYSIQRGIFEIDSVVKSLNLNTNRIQLKHYGSVCVLGISMLFGIRKALNICKINQLGCQTHPHWKIWFQILASLPWH